MTSMRFSLDGIEFEASVDEKGFYLKSAPDSWDTQFEGRWLLTFHPKEGIYVHSCSASLGVPADARGRIKVTLAP